MKFITLIFYPNTTYKEVELVTQDQISTINLFIMI